MRNLIGLGVWVKVASPAWCKAVINIPVAIPTDPTFTKGDRRTRLDYTFVSECLGQLAQGVRVRDDIDLRLSAEHDHSIVQAEVLIDLDKPPRRKPPTWKLHKDALADADTAKRFEGDLRKLSP